MYVCIHVAWCVCRGWEQTSAGGSPLQLGGFWGSASGPQGFQWVPSGLAVCSLTTWDILLAPSLDFKKLTTPNTKTLGLSSLASLKTEPIPSGGFFPVGDFTSSKLEKNWAFCSWAILPGYGKDFAGCWEESLPVNMWLMGTCQLVPRGWESQ